jgi:hypothetical protein
MLVKKACFGLLLIGATLCAAAPNVPVTSVKFRSGVKKLVFNAKLTRAIDAHVYTYAAKKGSHLKIDLESTSGMNSVVPMYHIEFPSGKAFGQKGYDPFNGKLTETGTYKIVVEVNQMASNGDRGTYRLTLKRY